MKQTQCQRHRWQLLAAVDKGRGPIRQRCTKCGCYRQRSWNFLDSVGYTYSAWNYSRPEVQP